MARAGLIFAALFVVTVVVLVLGVRRQMGVTCEVCVTFHGATACRTAAGGSHGEARRTAHENACALISSGMTDSVSCSDDAAGGR